MSGWCSNSTWSRGSPRPTRAWTRCAAPSRSSADRCVYCLEQVDHPGGGLDDLVIDTSRPLTAKHRPDLLGGVTTVLASGYRRAVAAEGWWPYPSRPGDGTEGETRATTSGPIELTAIPYYAWANRRDGSMRVWLPTS